MKKIVKAIVILVIGISAHSCTDRFEDMNVHPSKPTQTIPDYLFTNLVRNTGYSGSYILYMYNPQTYNMTRLATSAVIDNMYDLPNRSGIDASWNGYYNKLRDISELYKNIEEAAGSPERYDNLKHMLSIYHSYIVFVANDKFGDMPHSEAGKGLSELQFRPKYDDQQEIYTAELEALKTAVSGMVLSTTTPEDESIFDYEINNRLWRGESNAVSHFTAWKKFGTSLILKYALRMSKADPSKAAEYISWALSNGEMMSAREDGAALIPYRIDGWNNGSRKNAHMWAFYYNPTFRPGQFMVSKLADAADLSLIDSTEVFDKRFYAYVYPNKDGEYRILANSPDDNQGKDIIATTDIYPGGEWQKEMAHWSETGANYALWNRMYPMSMFQANWMLSYAEHNFVLAEIYASGTGTSVDHTKAQMYYEEGIKSSMEDLFYYEHVNYPDNNPDWLITAEQADIDAVINHPFNAYDQAKALDQIRTQRWLDYFARPDEAWSLMRRTNLFDVDNTVPLFTSGTKVEMVYKIQYPGSEISYNTEEFTAQLNKMGGQDDIFYKTWLWK
ncbi:MAG: SusD/RagB family nutrient-binding outer membrane lipoprotein [Cytophagales bacterium]|nr:SusD/RagB family nutrient-binding outer membrane lipoprotein [Cytophagales bacterium]